MNVNFQYVSKLFTISLGIAAVYFFYQENYAIGVLILTWALYRHFEWRLRTLDEITSYWPLERKCNCLLNLQINIEEVLKHPAVSSLFQRLRENDEINAEKFSNNTGEIDDRVKKMIEVRARISEEEWLKQLLQNYKKKYNCDTGLEKVIFHIKNNILWKNGKEEFDDAIYHQIFIPYEYKDSKEQEEGINVGLKIRILLVNGILKLQIGEFSKTISPKVIDQGYLNLKVYKTYETITSFPLLYFSYQHKIPVNYLNLCASASNSWYGDTIKGDKTKWKKRRDHWKEINKEIQGYLHLCSFSDKVVGISGKWEKIAKKFTHKRETWLKNENFQTFGSEDDDEDALWPEYSLDYFNNYMTINIVNYESWKKEYGDNLYSDYFEEEYYP